MKSQDEIIEELLDAAHRVLQHDTGPTEPEYVSGRNALKDDFKKVLAGKLKTKKKVRK